MTSSCLSFAKYWRQSLADASFTRGIIRESESKNLKSIHANKVQAGLISPGEASFFFENENSETDEVDVVLYTHIYKLNTEHAASLNYGLPERIALIQAKIKINRQGEFYPISASVPREILDPLATASFCVGTVQLLDEFLTKNPSDFFEPTPNSRHQAQAWSHFLKYCEEMERHVCSGFKERNIYTRLDYCLAQKKDAQKTPGKTS